MGAEFPGVLRGQEGHPRQWGPGPRLRLSPVRAGCEGWLWAGEQSRGNGEEQLK